MKNFDQFHETLNRHNSDGELLRPQAREAFQNLTGFMSLLIQINEREKIISFSKQESENNDD